MKKILITGSNGLLGQKIVNLLSQNNYKEKIVFLATSRGKNRLSSLPKIQYADLDISNPEMISEVVTKFSPQVIIHTAAMTQVDDCEVERELCKDLNVNAVKYFANICAKNDIFLVHLSTDFIFDGKQGPYLEDALPNPLSYYGQSKWEAEKIIQNTPHLRYAIARTVLVYGISEAMSRSNIILWVKKSLEEGKKIQVVDDQWRTPTLAEDLAMGCVLLAEQETKGIFNISGEELLTPYDMAIATADYFKLDKNLIEKTDGSKFTQAAKRPPKTGFIIDKAKNTLGFRPHSFLEGIELLDKQLKFIED
jgi:dTDP-4-dehydrorhamnose reductase